MKRTAVIPGSFDPVTKGHIDIIARAAMIFEEVCVLISINDEKAGLFSMQEKIAFLEDAVKEYSNVRVDSYKGLTVDYVKKMDSAVLVRGIRDERDVSAEQEYNYYNRSFDNAVDTLIMFSSEEFRYLSSSALKTLLLNGIDISHYVTPMVYKALKDKYQPLE